MTWKPGGCALVSVAVRRWLRVILVALVATSCVTDQRQAALSPSPTATAIETASPTPTIEPSPSPTPAPTPVPTARPTPKPRPTSNKAGLQLLPYYAQARQLFPIFPAVPEIDFDDPAG